MFIVVIIIMPGKGSYARGRTGGTVVEKMMSIHGRLLSALVYETMTLPLAPASTRAAVFV